MANPNKVKNGRRNAQKLLQSDDFEKALLKINQGDEEFEKAKKNPRQWLKDQGVSLPGNPDKVEIKEGSFWVKFCWGDFCIMFEWPDLI